MFAMISRRRTRYGTPIAAATLERIRVTLRASLNEAKELRWVDLDIERRELAITRQVVRTPAGLRACRPKSGTSVRSNRWGARDSNPGPTD
ncbi:hypothetical protein SAMN05421505_12564 [Sinosporangium album]|uniref:Integrase n=1 Tax=Sinosporangium album TaxID=504805 RepID=A0A1G8G2X8_9ACTN|nr:hypothetical protein [Sinosporangium album]SDH88768.1 hypothetical protein SAMN05421505_12564 [Sinosporangium album]